MAGVEADAEARAAAAGLEQRRELLERAPERAAGAGGVLEMQRAALGLGERLARRPRRRASIAGADRAAPSPSRGAGRRRARRSRRRRAANGSATASDLARISRSSEAQLSR